MFYYLTTYILYENLPISVFNPLFSVVLVTNDNKRCVFTVMFCIFSDTEQPLMTQSMRRAKLEEQYSKYERVVIRIQFQDKLVLQGLFKPRETGML